MSMPAFAVMETHGSTYLTAVPPRDPAPSAVQVRLTRKERELLLLLTQNPGRCVSRETLLRTIWHYSEGTRTRTVDVHVQRLRRKLGTAANSLKTIVRQGYCWFPEPEAVMGAGAL
jgi:DNA-binding response OmpR family regulator